MLLFLEQTVAHQCISKQENRYSSSSKGRGGASFINFGESKKKYVKGTLSKRFEPAFQILAVKVLKLVNLGQILFCVQKLVI